jgi:hypothetical protein
MRYARRALVAGGLGFVVSFIVACGGSGGLLSSDQANTLNGQLDQVASAVNAGNCGTVTNATSGLSDAVANLPGSVNATLRSNLDQGASTVAQLALQHCAQMSTATTPTTTTPSTTTTSTHTISTATTPPATTPATTITSPATTPAGSGTTSTGASGGAGLGAGGTGGSGGAGAGNGNGQ